MKIIIDVRDRKEFLAGHVAGALNISPDKLMFGYAPELASIPKNTEIIVYCRTGERANSAKFLLEDMGFKHVTNGISQAHIEAKVRDNAK